MFPSHLPYVELEVSIIKPYKINIFLNGKSCCLLGLLTWIQKLNNLLYP